MGKFGLGQPRARKRVSFEVTIPLGPVSPVSKLSSTALNFSLALTPPFSISHPTTPSLVIGMKVHQLMTRYEKIFVHQMEGEM